MRILATKAARALGAALAQHQQVTPEQARQIAAQVAVRTFRHRANIEWFVIETMEAHTAGKGRTK